jgi:20S proteasome alpha/beta subunit
MTVCVGAICQDKAAIVVASDRMVTTSMPPIEFEHTKRKIYDITNNCIALTAGNALIPIEIIPKIRAILTKTSMISQIAQNAKDIYQALRAQRAEELFMRPRAISKEIFYSRGASIFPPDLFRAIDHEFSTYNFNFDILLAGIDHEAHLYGITNPGIANCYDTISFHAIGIGYLHAVQVFIAHDYKVSYTVEEAVNIVYAAKKAAESAPGVGLETDISIITSNGINNLGRDVIEELSKIYYEVKKTPADEMKEKSIKLKKMLEKGGQK